MRLADANIILDRNNQELEAEDISYEYEMISAENQNQAESLARFIFSAEFENLSSFVELIVSSEFSKNERLRKRSCKKLKNK